MIVEQRLFLSLVISNFKIQLQMRSRSNSTKKYRKTTQEEFKENYCDQNYHYGEREPFSEFTDEPFTFDDSPARGRKFVPIQFSKFDKDIGGHLLAKDIVEENNHLKERLRESEDIIYELENELAVYRKEFANKQAEILQEREAFQKRMGQFRNEIVAIVLSNKKMEGELASLRNILQEKTLHRANRTNNNIKSLDRFCLKDNSKIISSIENLSEARKIEQLMDSIRNMHLKIMGYRTDNLKDLWRWLKSIGQTYSSLRRWRDQYADISVHSRSDRIRQALWCAFELID